MQNQYFLYTRKSTDVEDKQVMSIEAQLNELRALAVKDGLSVTQEFVEKQSAKAPGRPIFNELLARIEKGEAQGIILRPLLWRLLGSRPCRRLPMVDRRRTLRALPVDLVARPKAHRSREDDVAPPGRRNGI